MSGMQRFISYLYLYENEEKAGNVGFAKIELRGEDCRIEVHMRGTFTNNLSCKIYLFTNEQNFIHGICIGDMKILNGVGNFGKIIPAAKIGPAGKTFAQMDGLLVLCEDERIFATKWKEGVEVPIGLRTFREDMMPVPEKALRPEQQTMSRSVSDPEQSENVSSPEQQEQLENMSSPERQEQSEKVSGPEQQDTAKPESADIHVAEVPMRNIFPELEWRERWKSMLEEYPVSQPFENKEITCVRIELKDLRELPKRYWYLGNNSFLLHGFFNYHHLLIGNEVGEDDERWFLGVPGVYQPQERVMAAIFGFQEFIPEQGHHEHTGEPLNQFGYWCRVMDE